MMFFYYICGVNVVFASKTPHVDLRTLILVLVLKATGTSLQLSYFKHTKPQVLLIQLSPVDTHTHTHAATPLIRIQPQFP